MILITEERRGGGRVRIVGLLAKTNIRNNKEKNVKLITLN